MAGNSEPLDSNYRPINAVLAPGVGLVVQQGGAVSTDTLTGLQYAPGVVTGGTGSGTTQAAPGYTRFEDGQSTLLCNVVAYHSGDNQNVGGSGGSLLTAGVAQLLNALGNADRQRNISTDQQPSLGISAGAASFAQYFATTSTAGSITGGASSATITPANMFGIVIGNALTISGAGLSETVYVTSLPSGTTATVVPANGAPTNPTFKNSYSGSYTISGFLYNIERDASGENSGASGRGTAVAAEYEYTSGGPVLASGIPSLLSYDREVAALGKGAVNSGAGYAITSTTAGATSLTPTTPANFSSVTPGSWVRLSGSGTNEYVRVADSYVIAASPSTIPLTNPVINAGQTTATWDAFSANGPGQNPVLWTGEGFEGVILNDRTQPGFGRAFQGNSAGEASMTVGGLQTTAVAAAASANIKAAPGRIARVLVTSAGTASLIFYDNATGASTGTIVGITPTTTTVGQVFDFQFPALIGISAVGGAGSPGVTVSYS